jgi:hypothetical protein
MTSASCGFSLAASGMGQYGVRAMIVDFADFSHG